jgi:hypothetical protein
MRDAGTANHAEPRPADQLRDRRGGYPGAPEREGQSASQIAQGVTAITPAGIVVGALAGSEGTKLQVASGDYNGMIDQRIAAIKSKCRLP